MVLRSNSERRNSSDTERDITTLAESTINDLLDRIKCTTESTTLLNDGETVDTTVDTRDTTCDSVTITRESTARDTDSEKTSQCVTERDLTSVTRESQMIQNGDKTVTISEGTSTDRPPRLDQDTLSRIDSVRKESNSDHENLVRSISKTDCQIFNELEKMGTCLG